MFAIRSGSRGLRRLGITEKIMRNAWADEASAINATQQRGVTGDVYDVGSATNIKFHDGMVPRETKEKIMNQKGVVIWFTGTINSCVLDTFLLTLVQPRHTISKTACIVIALV